MSGFEIVGVILGAVPLIISALEGCHSLSRRKSFFDKRTFHVVRLINALKEQRVLIESDLEILLRSAGLDHVALAGDREGAYRGLLERDELVRSFMGSRYEPYLDTLADCEKTLFQVAKEIVGLKPGSWINDGKLESMLKMNSNLKTDDGEVRKRLKFSMRKPELDKAINALDTHTKMLKRLRILSISVNQQAAESTSQRSLRAIRLLQKIQNKAQSLFNALSLNSSQQCHKIHEARLSLDNRLQIFEASNTERCLRATEVVSFCIVLKCFTAAGGDCSYAEVIEALDADRDAFGGAHTPTTVTWNFPGVHGPAPSTTNLSDLCDALVHSSSPKKSIKMYLHHEDRLCYSHEAPSSPPQNMNTAASNTFIGLKDVLEGKQKRLALQQRVKLAATIALSAMQLCATPWYASLRKEIFWFPAQDQGGSGLTLDQPFICCSFSNSVKTGERSPPQTVRDLLELGILIIELWRQECLESFCQSSGILLADDYDSRRMAARMWLERDEHEFVDSVYNAAFTCVECRMERTVVDWSDVYVRRLIFNNVVQPLLQTCRVKPGVH